VSNAIASATGILAGSLAAMIELVAGLAPWLLVVGLVVWLLRKRLPKWGRAAPKATAPQPPPPKQD
jgi:type IV secretory pathway TrbD component